MIQYRSIQEIRAEAPFPWRQEVYGRGNVRMVDANGREVGLFAITGFAVLVTAHLAASTQNAPAAPATPT
jgi:hypothetical protein